MSRITRQHKPTDQPTHHSSLHRVGPNHHIYKHKLRPGLWIVAVLGCLVFAMAYLGLNSSLQLWNYQPLQNIEPLIKPAPNSPLPTPQPLVIKINSQRLVANTPPYDLGAGRSFLVLDVQVTQTARDQVWLSPILQTTLKGMDGTSYPLSPTTLEHPLDAHFYNKGDTAVGELSYDVPSDVKDLQWCYEINPPGETSPIRRCIQIKL